MRTDRRPWTVALARQRAREILSDMGKGIDHNADKKAAIIERDGALTLAPSPRPLRWRASRQPQERALDRDGRIRRTAVALEVAHDRPLADLTVERVQGIKENGRKHKTQTNRLLAELSALWNVARRLRRTSFTAENPIGKAFGVQKMFRLEGRDAPQRDRVLDEDLPEWLRRVQLLSPIRRDLQLVTMFTGMRDSKHNQHALGARQPD